MPYTYPIQANNFAINANPRDIQAALSSTNVVGRILSEQAGLTESRFLTYKLLSGRYVLDGQSITYAMGDPKLPDGVETIAAGAEYPRTTLTPEQLRTAEVLKRGHSTFITDEAITQQSIEAVNRSFGILAASLIRDFDRIGIGVIGSSLPIMTASTAWSNSRVFLQDLLTMKSKISQAGEGLYLPDTLVLSETSYAKLLPAVLDILPRESNVVTGEGWATVQGVTILTNPQAGSLTDPMLLDSTMLGGLAIGNIVSPGYVRIGTVADVQNIREAKNDAWMIQARTIALPVVTNPGAGLIIKGTGL
ncbi:MAG: hypothetical protein ACRDAX_06035 [Propionibacteriaceae bacterium]